MRLAYIASSLVALVLSGVSLQASATTSILDDPACVKKLTPEEIRGLKICVERGVTCTTYWPNQKDDLQKCEAAAAWIRTAKTWPLARRNEVFGAEWPPASVSGSSSPEPAWKKLPRSGNTSATPQVKIPDNASAAPYAGTSAAITPEAARSAGWNVGAITGTIEAVGQIAQDQTAIEDPESALAAKEVLGSMGMGQYAASDEAMVKGREAEAAYAKAHPSTTTATTTGSAAAATSSAATTTAGSQDELIASLKAHAIPECVEYRDNRFFNICYFDIEITFCIDNPTPFDKAPLTDAGAAYDCAKDQYGLWTIEAGKAMAGTFSGKRAFYSACKRPYSPVKIKGIVGGADHYACK